MPRAELEGIARRWVELGWQRGDAEAVREMYAATFVDHGAPAGQAANRDGTVAGIVALYAAFPDFFAEVTRLVTDTDAGTVAVAWVATGIHRGVFLGAAPTGRRVSFSGIEIIRVVDRQIIERWEEWDGVALLDQLGARP